MKDMYDYMEEMDIDDMLGEIFVSERWEETPNSEVNEETGLTSANSKPSIHPLWNLIDTWGGRLYLKVRQLTLWGVDDE